MQDGGSALILAAAQEEADCLRLLLDAGANTDFMSNVRGVALLFESASSLSANAALIFRRLLCFVF